MGNDSFPPAEWVQREEKTRPKLSSSLPVCVRPPPVCYRGLTSCWGWVNFLLGLVENNQVQHAHAIAHLVEKRNEERILIMKIFCGF